MNMDGPQALLDTQTMEMLVRRDLITNVYKNGKWGCYVHLPLDSSKLFTLKFRKFYSKTLGNWLALVARPFPEKSTG